MNQVQKEVSAWSTKTFGRDPSRIHGMMAHLEKEVAELEKTVTLDGASKPGCLRDELADCIMLLYDMADISGFDVNQIVREKLMINKAREWGPPNPDGSVEHVRKP